MHALTVYRSLVSASLRGQLSYPGSFALNTLGQLISSGIEIAGILFLFHHIPELQGWTLWEVMYFYGVATIGLNVSELFISGLDEMPHLVRDGDFDRLLVRPSSPLLQVIARELKLFRLGKVAQGVLALWLALAFLDVHWGALEIGMLVASLISGVAVFSALFVAGATTCFWTIESSEAFNAFTYGGVQMAQFPASIYPAWLRRLFFYVIPVGFVTYFPALVVLGKPDPLGFPAFMPYLAPAVAAAFLGLALLFWRIGVNHYQSTGS